MPGCGGGNGRCCGERQRGRGWCGRRAGAGAGVGADAGVRAGARALRCARSAMAGVLGLSTAVRGYTPHALGC